jgi:hypothetical protein
MVDMLMYEWLDACAVWPWYEVSYLLKVGFHFLLQHSLSSRLLLSGRDVLREQLQLFF